MRTYRFLQFYLDLFNDQCKVASDNPALGIVLCADRNETTPRYSSLSRFENLYTAQHFPVWQLWEREFGTTPTIEQLYEPLELRIKVPLKPNGQANEQASADEQVSGQANEQASADEQVSGQASLADRLYWMLKREAWSSYETAAKRLGVSVSTVRRAMHNLQSKGMVRRVGADKNGHWEVICEKDGD